MSVLRTAWIGGSYEAACGGEAPPETKVRGATSNAILRLLILQPGADMVTIREHLHMSKKAATMGLDRLRKADKVHSIVRKGRGRWFVGSAPRTINHVTGKVVA